MDCENALNNILSFFSRHDSAKYGWWGRHQSRHGWLRNYPGEAAPAILSYSGQVGPRSRKFHICVLKFSAADQGLTQVNVIF